MSAEVDRSSNKDAGLGTTARTYCRMEHEDPGRGKKAEERVTALPGVPAPATGGDSAMRPSREATQWLDGMAASSCEEPCVRHPLQGFDDLLKAFDGFIDAPEGGTRIIVDLGQPGKSDKNNKRDAAMAVDPYTRQLFPCPNTPDDDGNRLPRLYSRSSSAPVGPSWFQKRPRTDAKRRRTSRAQPAKGFSPLSRYEPPSLAPEHVVNNLQHADPFELMLRSKANRRPDLQGLGRQPGLAIQPTEDDDLGTSSGEGAAGIDYGVSKAMSGVFRLTHTGTGFVHYGYSWDIAGAKEDQLRRLRMARSDDTTCNNIGGGPHPHRGLSAIVRGQQENPSCVEQLEPEGVTPDNSFKAVSNGEVQQQLRFEVVRLVPLPTRFRASDFEETMRQACEQELLDRRGHLLVLVARQYKRNHVGPTFSRILLGCRSDGDDEKCAAAAEVQRVWRGFCVREASRCAREKECHDRLANEQARISAVLAAWGQSTHRGNMGRRRARGLRDERAQAAEHRKQALALAAVTIQYWVRRLYKRRKQAEAAADKAAVDALLRAIRLEKKEATSELPPRGTTSKGPTRSINTPEARLARGPCDADAQASLAGSLHGSAATFAGNTGGNIAPAGSSGRRQQRRRPSSSREGRLGSTTRSRGENDNQDPPQDFPLPPSKKQRGDRRPASAPRPNQMAGTAVGRPPPRGDSVPAATATAPAAGFVPVSTVPDASRLVLEGHPRFTAATAIQAAWRGFTARLGMRKRRRAAAALRRKREGKWRQQRGVVGKRVSVAWDERRGLEEGAGGRGNGGGGTASCIEIQVLYLRDDGGGAGAGLYYPVGLRKVSRPGKTRHLPKVAYMMVTIHHHLGWAIMFPLYRPGSAAITSCTKYKYHSSLAVTLGSGSRDSNKSKFHPGGFVCNTTCTTNQIC